MCKYDVNAIFDQYENVDVLNTADIFHLYDTGEECMKDNSGFHDSRHFDLYAFNSEKIMIFKSFIVSFNG